MFSQQNLEIVYIVLQKGLGEEGCWYSMHCSMGSTFEDSESYSTVSAQNQNTTLESESLQNNFSLITLATMLLWSSTCPSTNKVTTWYHPKWCGMEIDGKREVEKWMVK